ncbi:MAG: hypothetical protein BWY09_02706 [Candidatus Hydrogenedentes bacterium ADurb.Bin179]|nr:MAG: hypothetical protein BWY09_02706 [Candidatus Hydrogenedentes bacterium ADurb.Bin179]
MLREGAYFHGSGHVAVGEHNAAPDAPGTQKERPPDFGRLTVSWLVETGIVFFEVAKVLAH